MKDVSKVIGQVTKLGGKLTENVTIKLCTIANRTRGEEAIVLELNTPVPTIKLDDDGNSVVKNTRHPYVRTFGVVQALPDTEEGAIITKVLNDSILHYEEALLFATCDILSIPVKADTEFLSPFSDEPKPYPVKRDAYYHFLVNLRLGKVGLEAIYDAEAANRRGKLKAVEARAMREYEAFENERNAIRNKLRSIVSGESDDSDEPEDNDTK